MKIPFISFDTINQEIEKESILAFQLFFNSQNYILGNELLNFENNYAKFLGVKHAIGVGSGLDALIIALQALGIQAQDEVIIPSHTYIATAMAVSRVGAKPILAEPNPQTYNIDAASIAKCLTDKTKAIIPVHLYGQPCQMDEIMNLADQHGIWIVEDNAQAQGATFAHKRTGSIGHVSATSFYPVKNLGAFGDGGMITTHDDLLAKKIISLRNYGSPQKHEHEIIGYNSRLDELQAALLNIKLKRLDRWNIERQKIADWYDILLVDNANIIKPFIAHDHVFHLYVIRHHKRNELQKYLEANGVRTLIHYPIPIHLQQAYRHLGYRRGDFPIAERLADEVLSLPLFIGMSKEQVAYVCDCIHRFDG